MAAVPIVVPGVGESITEGILARWLKPDGSVVKAGEPLFELETDKASNVVPAAAGGLLKVAAAEGDTVAIGATIGTLDPDGKAAAVEKAAPAPAPAPAPAAPSPNGGATSAEAALPLSPAVRRITAEEHVDPAKVAPTGPGGRITKGDVIEHLAKPAAPEKPAPPAAPAASPVVKPSAPPSAPAATARPSAGRETRQRMSGLRQKIAQRLVEAQHTAAILTTFNEVDVSRVSELRARYKESFKAKHGVGLGFMSFFVKAAIEALKAFPAVNGRIDGTDIVYNNAYDIGVAVSTERGLMVPVIRDADTLSFAAIEKTIAGLGERGRKGTITVDELQGGTFTITNGGVFGSLLSTPILNPPQSGILGMHSIKKRPVVVDDQIVIRPMMYLALSYDHRIIDGREAVSFLVRIKECIEEPERMLLDL
ncbi:2-oxoglutarate dehydrogenase complex dihydrolipoyllysine-residue succinyltransferase [Aquisphaera insulae]|uniref:2-oxoglutarate dehydrogenase complex dihydrolipoyllysine-residue succinyltransferase n=1 Tax=Aquisphaera insulae TaxID=2712864 RepID=UPI0013EDBBF0|nr:2-oxoglutarate dehydrogenase complex dihydrolipoyllysine-residue succinyltransferase [Aquisphaera insulae]